MEVDGDLWRTKIEKKVETWRLLRTLHHQSSLHWVCMGDFNVVLYNHEKQGGVPWGHALLQNFQDALQFCDLNYLGFEGDVFT